MPFRRAHIDDYALDTDALRLVQWESRDGAIRLFVKNRRWAMAELIRMNGTEEPRFGLIEREQLAAQMLAILDAHFKRPSADEKLAILIAARQQVEATLPPL